VLQVDVRTERNEVEDVKVFEGLWKRCIAAREAAPPYSVNSTPKRLAISPSASNGDKSCRRRDRKLCMFGWMVDDDRSLRIQADEDA
jgi:hypothetical protein